MLVFKDWHLWLAHNGNNDDTTNFTPVDQKPLTQHFSASPFVAAAVGMATTAWDVINFPQVPPDSFSP